jgi:hypothetical protein
MATDRNGMAMGFTFFAAVMMIVLGAIDALQGLAAIIKQHYYVVAPNYAYKLSVSGWGWLHLILGILVVLAGFGLLSGALWARIVGVVLAVLVIFTNFMWLPYYPVWSILVIAVSVIVIWALTAHGHELAG